ncbi:MAG: arsenate reductase (glutaredoxin) [bacterium]
MTTIYHNPRCSKSRATLALLRERGVEAEVVEYLSAPPDAALLRSLAAMLGGSARDLIRDGEAEYRELGLGDASLSEAALIAAVAANPKLLQRPIVVHRGKAAIGRPPENVLAIL